MRKSQDSCESLRQEVEYLGKAKAVLLDQKMAMTNQARDLETRMEDKDMQIKESLERLESQSRREISSAELVEQFKLEADVSRAECDRLEVTLQQCNERNSKLSADIKDLESSKVSLIETMKLLREEITSLKELVINRL